MVHSNYGFANPTTYEKLFNFISSRKEHVVSATLKILSQHFNSSARANYTKEQHESFMRINQEHVEKLKQFCISGRSKHAKHSLHLIYNNFERPENEKILEELFKELSSETNLKNGERFITSLVSLDHLSLLVPSLDKQLKEFVTKTVAKEFC